MISTKHLHPQYFIFPAKLKNILPKKKVCNYEKNKKMLMTEALITFRFLKLLALSSSKFQHMGILGIKFLKKINSSKKIINAESNKVLKVHLHLEIIFLNPFSPY